MRVLITGGTGYIGGATARRLLGRGDRVVVLARRPERVGGAGGLAAIAPDDPGAVTVVRGDLLDAGSLARAAEGCDAVIHCAGHPRPGSWRLMRRVHVEGTRNVVEAARAVGVRRVVNIASQAVLFSGRDLVDLDESCPYPKRYIDPYSATKAEAERVALEANRPGELEVTSIRPAVVWGRGDTTILPIMVRLARGPVGIPMCGDGSNLEATSHIDNLVDGILAAMESPRAPGRAYFILDGFEITWREFYTRMLAAVGVRARFFRVPRGIAVWCSWALDAGATALRLPVPLAYFGVRLALTSRRFSLARAREELGYQPRVSLDDGLADLASWAGAAGGARALAHAR